MKKLGFVLAAAVLMLMTIAMVEEVNAQKKGGGGGGFGGFGGFGPQTPLTLLNRADVKEELKVTDEQMEKIPAEVMVAIGRVLDEKQFKRFKQLDLQKSGNSAFKNAEVQKTLKVTDDQKKTINTILEGATKEIADLNKDKKGGFGGFGKGNPNQEKIDNINADTKDKLLAVLTKDQRKTYRDLIGADFKFTQGFGGLGKDKKGPAKDAKKDAE